MRALSEYRTLVFDCDGVVLDSNRVKTDAFFQAALPYGEAAAQALVDYHVANGGISRYRKFEYLLQEIIGESESPEGMDGLLKRYAALVHDGLLGCRVAAGLAELRSALPSCNWLIASGGDQTELRQVFAARSLEHYFDGGIFGSPDAKVLILEREVSNGNIQPPALFMGDSRYDHQCAVSAGLDFLFLSGWSEFLDWREYFAASPVPVRVGLTALLKCI
jgi:phosphoglycolate phosphatase-like HAD superfamily hydrolase